MRIYEIICEKKCIYKFIIITIIARIAKIAVDSGGRLAKL